MAEYKVIQDIEAEDKLLGPLTLRQFIYAAIVVAHLFVMWLLYAFAPLLIALFIPTAIFFGALAAPLGGAQSSEVWLLAKIRFFIKPRKRIWNQDGLQELVTITAPKKIEKQLTDNLSRVEVKSRLTALANTLDSRGWAIKHAYAPAYGSQTSDDRLLNTADAFDMEPTDQTVDVMDESTSDVARQFQNLIQQSTQAHRAAVIDKVQHPGQQNNQQADYWFMSGQTNGQQTNYRQKTVLPGSDDSAVHAADDSGDAEQEFLDKRHKDEAQKGSGYSHLKTLQPLGKQSKHSNQAVPEKTEDKTDSKAQARQKNPDIMRLASNDDLNVSTIAREANRAQQGDDGEVVISLH